MVGRFFWMFLNISKYDDQANICCSGSGWPGGNEILKIWVVISETLVMRNAFSNICCYGYGWVAGITRY